MKKIAFYSLSLLTAFAAKAQTGSIGIGTTTPVAGAALEIKSSNAGLLIPRLTAAQRTGMTTPPQGLLVYQTDGTAGGGAQTGFWYYGGTGGWLYLNAGALNLPYSDSYGGAATTAISVTHTGNGTAILGTTNATAAGAAGVKGDAPSGNSAAGLLGTTTDGYGVRGIATQGGYGINGTSTDSRGVDGLSSSGPGVYGSSASGNGVTGTTSASSATIAGVQGIANGGTSATAVLGSTTNGTGVRGVASASGGFGVTGNATDARGVNGVSISGNGVHGTSTSGNGVYGTTNSNNASIAGVTGNNNNAGLSAVGVLGSSSNGTGVVGVSTTNNGVRGTTLSSGGKGVIGQANAGGIGVYGESNGGTQAGVYGTSGSGDGVYGISNASNNNSFPYAGVTGISIINEYSVGVYGGSQRGYGVRGVVSGDGAYGVSGESIGSSGNGAGIFGSAANSNAFAGYFAGKVYVSGNLSKSLGSFKIDHPLDPANKYLYHSFVESPDMMNIYNGNITLDAKGEAVVEMPAWFEALNRDFRYQLTSIGAFMPVFVKEEMSNRRFRIAGGTPGGKVSWQVTGIRHDKYAEAHRIPVEEEKAAADRGRYLTPDVYGQPESEGIGRKRSVAKPATTTAVRE